MGLRRWAISAAGAAGLAALARRRMARPGGAASAPAAQLPPAPNPLTEGGDPAQAIDAARERLRREAEARGEGASG
jgi:hypothetical protein